MKKGLVSVIIPVYNAQKTIANCINSLISQTYKAIEIILVDNGSVDESVLICEKYAKCDGRVIVESSSQGVSNARNRGIFVSKGEYLIFVDSDDWIETDAVENMVNSFEKNCLNIYGYYVDVYKHNKKYQKKKSTKCQTYLNDYDAAITLFSQGFLGSVWNKIYESEIIKNNNISFDNTVNLGEDISFNLDYLRICNMNIITRDKAYYHYIRKNDDSLVHGFNEDFLNNQNQIYNKAISVFDGNSSKNSLSILFGMYFDAVVVSIDNVYLHSKYNKTNLFFKRQAEAIEIIDKKKIINSIIGNKRNVSRIRFWLIKNGAYVFDYAVREVIKTLLKMDY